VTFAQSFNASIRFIVINIVHLRARQSKDGAAHGGPAAAISSSDVSSDTDEALIVSPSVQFTFTIIIIILVIILIIISLSSSPPSSYSSSSSSSCHHSSTIVVVILIQAVIITIIIISILLARIKSQRLWIASLRSSPSH
jgi:hypothetical protein